MDDDRKFEISSAVGTTVFFISCIGIGSYEDAVHEGYESIHEKLPMEPSLQVVWSRGLYWL